MSWFNGEYEETKEEFENRYPVKICKGLCFNEDHTKMALINSFPEGNALFVLADPHAEDEDAETVFYHVFMGADASKAADTVKRFVESDAAKEPENFELMREGPEGFFMYAYGHICLPLLDKQDALRKLLPEDLQEKNDVFVLPLKRHLYRCPVCGMRSLLYRGMFEICPQCGWEDEGIDDEDEEPCFCPNGEYTIREYREEVYLPLKKANPGYRWSDSFEEE